LGVGNARVEIQGETILARCRTFQCRDPAGGSVSKTVDERSLVDRCLKGDERAFEELVSRYEGALYRLAWRLLRNEEEARDVVQETFLRVFRALHTYDRERRFSTWLLRIGTNLCIDLYRRRRMRLVSVDADEGDELQPVVLVARGAGPSERHAERALAETLDRLLARLPAIYRIVIELRYKQQLAYEEIAEILEIPLGTVKARLHRAHRQLKEHLQAAGLGPDDMAG
jgi:RNA polymerase sigma-70 factor (ECF subfamily)